ncbi:pentatricopeptide repeat-containing protein [Panicum miliaceum]|uniref:Pentatricopeptide repeat-containing protein n=1 Tax=Panicum miliaceum TaxID=4540 RepID=A0A3L6QXP3_PANMI|nr:pentatricopeptide repeat-containing protein [Panicum miliaceum]
MAPPPNASMGMLNMGGCGALLPTPQPNSSQGRGFLVPGRSVSVLPLRWGLARKRGRVLDSRTDGAVAGGEAGAGSSDLRHIEKELTFSPTFTDYVKIMESVKLDRSKNLHGSDSDGRSSRRRFTGDGDRRGDGRSSDARNKPFERNQGPRRDGGSDRGRGVKLATDENRKDVNGLVERRAPGDRGANVNMGKFVRRDAEATYFDDRAAFKAFEVFTDVRDRPQILRMEMEERIQKLASRYIYTTVLDVLGKAKRPIEALNVFYTMQVLNACVQQKQWEGAFWVLQQLKEKNIRPTNTTYGVVMEVMLVCGKYNLVYEFFNKVEKSSIPGALNYKVLVNALWRERKIDEAVMAVKDMESRGIVGSASLYYDLARCLCSVGQCKEALPQVEKVCKVANKPLVVTYTGLIQTCIDNGSMENAKYIFSEMCSYCSPNTVTCNIMLKSFLEHGMLEDAKDLLQDILNGRIRSKVDSSQTATADKFTFNTFMEACAAAQRWDDFESAFRGMLSKGYHFDERRHLRMVLDACRNGKLLDDLWRYLCHYNRAPPAPVIMERFCLKLVQGDTMAAISCVSRFQEGKIQNTSSMSWLNLLNRNADRLKEEHVTKLAHELSNFVSSRSSSDNISLYQKIQSSCTAFLSGATVVEKAPSDQQMSMALHHS